MTECWLILVTDTTSGPDTSQKMSFIKKKKDVQSSSLFHQHFNFSTQGHWYILHNVHIN